MIGNSVILSHHFDNQQFFTVIVFFWGGGGFLGFFLEFVASSNFVDFGVSPDKKKKDEKIYW